MPDAHGSIDLKEGPDLYRALSIRRLFILAVLAVMLFGSLIVDIALGPANFPLDQVLTAVLNPAAVEVQLQVVVWHIRMPMALMAVVTGAALAAAGAQMQTILANPLASPFTLGISAAASFGAALAFAAGVAVVPWATDFIVPVNAFVMALLASALIFAISQARGATVQTVILLGIALGFTFDALLALMQYVADEAALASIVFWTMGSLAKATWPKFWITLVVFLIALPLFARNAWALTAMRLGDDKAASFGVNVTRVRLETMLLVSLLAAVPVSFVGTIGFIGLVGPHIARMIVGEDQRFFLPASVLTGALLLSVASTASKLIVPGIILPIGMITVLIGLPFFFSLVVQSTRRAW
jgi:iron complex transport system permease protein